MHRIKTRLNRRPQRAHHSFLNTSRSMLVLLPALLPIVVSISAPAFAQAPGPELFAKEPQTPMELWEAVDYLLRTSQPKKALPYIDKFIKAKPDAATWIAIRNRFGPGSILRLSDDPSTQPFAKPLSEAMLVASRSEAQRPERIARYITALNGTRPEQQFAVRRLREAGPFAVPLLVQALNRPGLSAGNRQQIVDNMGELDRSAVPPLVAALDSPGPALASDAAAVLGMIGDKRAIPPLTEKAASPQLPETVRKTAERAVARLTGLPFDSQEQAPTQVLADAAWRLHRHQVDLGGEPVLLWAWDKEKGVPTPREVSSTEAEAILGLRFANDALRLSPNDRSAQVVHLSLTLEKAIERLGVTSLPTADPAIFAAAKAAGASRLTDVLNAAIADGKYDLAAVAASALGGVVDKSELLTAGQPHPLVTALYAPGRHLQFAAARAILGLGSTQSFPGSSRVVPALARFLTHQTIPRAVVIDANPNRGSQLAGFLIELGYDSDLEQSGSQGFLAAASPADVELILISYDLFGQGWALRDTVANLKADSRTAATPIYIYGPLNAQYVRPNLKQDYPGIKFLVQPVDAATLKRQLKELPRALSDPDRASYAKEATELLMKIAKDRKGPFAADLANAEEALVTATQAPETAQSAATALAELGSADAQRTLADLVLDPSRALPLRKQVAADLVRSIQRFGPLMTIAQEGRLLSAVREAADSDLQDDLETVVRALRPVKSKADTAKPRLNPS
jgi:HEAT repeat protein